MVGTTGEKCAAYQTNSCRIYPTLDTAAYQLAN